MSSNFRIKCSFEPINFCLFAVECSDWSSTVTSSNCVSSLLMNNGWANASQVAAMSTDDQVSALKVALNLNTNGTFHSIVELSAR